MANSDNTGTWLPKKKDLEFAKTVLLVLDVSVSYIDEEREEATLYYTLHTFTQCIGDDEVRDNVERSKKFHLWSELSDEDRQLIREDDYPIPVVRFRNAVEQTEQDVRRFFCPRSRTLYWQAVGSATIEILNDFRAFPYDVQTLYMQVECSNYNLAPAMTGKENSGGSSVMAVPSSWTIKELSTYFWTNTNEMILGLSLTRKSLFYLEKYCLVVFLIVACNAVCMAVEIDETIGRSQISITLLLTLVLFKFSLQSGISKANYSTRLDHYFTLATGFLIAGIIETCAMSEVTGIGVNPSQKNDTIFHLVYLGSWIAIHLLIFFLSRSNWLQSDLQKAQARWGKDGRKNRRYSLAPVRLQ